MPGLSAPMGAEGPGIGLLNGGAAESWISTGSLIHLWHHTVVHYQWQKLSVDHGAAAYRDGGAVR